MGVINLINYFFVLARRCFWSIVTGESILDPGWTKTKQRLLINYLFFLIMLIIWLAGWVATLPVGIPGLIPIRKAEKSESRPQSPPYAPYIVRSPERWEIVLNRPPISSEQLLEALSPPLLHIIIHRSNIMKRSSLPVPGWISEMTI